MPDFTYEQSGNRVIITHDRGQFAEPVVHEWETDFTEDELTDIFVVDDLCGQLEELFRTAKEGSGFQREIVHLIGYFPRGTALRDREEAILHMNYALQIADIVALNMTPEAFAHVYGENGGSVQELFTGFGMELKQLIQKYGWEREIGEEELIRKRDSLARTVQGLVDFVSGQL